MKAISIRQPWASLIVAGVKDIENRSWITDYRGELIIHSSLKIDKVAMGIVEKLGLGDVFIKAMYEYIGGIIGKVELVDCVKSSDSQWFEGPYGFVLKNPKVLPFKKMRGMLGIFDIDKLNKEDK